jgi:hypothetical protein
MAALGNRTQQVLQLESSMGVVECHSTLCIQLWMLTPWRLTRLLGGASSTAVLGSFDSSRRTPLWRFTPEQWMIGTESLR